MTRCKSCGIDFEGRRCSRCSRSVDEFPDLFLYDIGGIGFDESLNPTLGLGGGVSMDLDGGGINVLGISVGKIGDGVSAAAGLAGDAAGAVVGAAGDVASGTVGVLGDAVGIAGDVVGGVAEVAGDLVDGIDV